VKPYLEFPVVSETDITRLLTALTGRPGLICERKAVEASEMLRWPELLMEGTPYAGGLRNKELTALDPPFQTSMAPFASTRDADHFGRFTGFKLLG
jgi:hypothetical protein